MTKQTSEQSNFQARARTNDQMNEYPIETNSLINQWSDVWFIQLTIDYAMNKYKNDEINQ
jgi:hypothetical protein